MTESSHHYRSAALAGCTQLDLLIGAYDAIAEDLRRMAAAVLAGSISARCEASDHALLLLGHLESWLEFLDEPPLQASLAQFYGYVRGMIMGLQTTSEPRLFLDLALKVSETRAAWQTRFSRPRNIPEVLAPGNVASEARMSWTA